MTIAAIIMKKQHRKVTFAQKQKNSFSHFKMLFFLHIFCTYAYALNVYQLKNFGIFIL